jgi:chitinase
MIGINDASSEVVTLTDVDTITSYASSQGMAGVHFWSLDRDTPCPGGSGGFASPTCNSVSGSTALQYTNRFLHDLGH